MYPYIHKEKANLCTDNTTHDCHAKPYMCGNASCCSARTIEEKEENSESNKREESESKLRNFDPRRNALHVLPSPVLTHCVYYFIESTIHDGAAVPAENHGEIPEECITGRSKRDAHGFVATLTRCNRLRVYVG